MKKRLVAILMTGVLALGLAGCTSNKAEDSSATNSSNESNNTSSEKKETTGENIKIGVIYSATGTMAGRGEYMKNALVLAAEEINAAGGVLDKEIELVFEDDQSDQTTAINMMNKMGSDNEIVAVFGPHTSTNAIAVSNTVEEYGIPYFTGGTSSKLKTIGNQYMFKVRCNDTVVVDSAMKFVSESLGAKKVGILFINDEFGVGGRDIMVQYCEDNGLEYIEANHNGTDQDLTSQIMKMKQENVDVLVAWSSNVCPIVARQTTELGFDKPVIMNSGFGGQDVLDSLSTEYTEGKYAACDFTAEDPTQEAAAFVKAYVEAYGVKPLGDWSASYYGGLKALVSAIETAGSADRNAIKDAMYNVKEFSAPLGNLTVDANGCLVHETSIIQAEVQDDGKAVFKLVEKIKESGY